MFSFLNSPVYIRKRNTNVPRFCFFGSLQCTVMSLKQRVLLLSPSEEQCKYSIYTCCIMYSICMHMVHALLQSFIILILIILAQQSYSPTYCVHCTLYSVQYMHIEKSAYRNIENCIRFGIFLKAGGGIEFTDCFLEGIQYFKFTLLNQSIYF